MVVLAIDQGRNHTGWAVFNNAQLTACGVSKLPKESRIWGLEKVVDYHYRNLPTVTPERVILEKHWLTKAREPTLSQAIAKGTDLLSLQAVAFYIAGKLGGAISLFSPFQCSKTMTKNRVEYLLKGAELDLYRVHKGKTDDLADAICLGLRAVGRMG
jgi:Holliday junction resolvasome RuvABC endonuclease subunit